ncbi:MAG: MATE family efflux transporter [Eubacterium sp.]|nr:MATE family efflux transporter [Eubacterium sp.]
MEDVRKTDLFEKMPIKSAVLKLSIPTVLSSLVMVIYNLADTYFVGILNNSVENAAVTLAAPLLLAFNAVNNLFGVGSSSMMSRALGKKDYETVYRSSAFGFYCSVISGLIFSLLYTALNSQLLIVLGADSETTAATAEYLKWTVSFGAVPAILNVVMAYLVRAEGASLHASVGTMSGCVLNMILDPIFVLPWGLDMGASGAGCATFISNCFACIYFFVLLYVKRKSTYVCVNPKKFSFRKSIVTGVFSVGIPASIQNLLNVTGMTVLNNFTSAFGAEAVAAMGIAQKINMVPMQIALGSSQGVMPLIGYTYASGNTDRMKKSLMFLSKYALGFLAVITVGFYFGSDLLISLFMKNEAIISYGSEFLKGLCLSLPFLCMDFIAVGVFQACGMGGKSLIFAIMRKIVLEIPFIFLLNYLFPLYGLAYAQTMAEVILAAAAIAVLISMFKKLKAK